MRRRAKAEKGLRKDQDSTGNSCETVAKEERVKERSRCRWLERE